MSDQGDSYELDALLGAYALDAVDEDERRRVEDYLRVNPKAEAEVQAHREVATMLAFTGMDAPEGLWSKITAEIDAEAPAPGPELAKVFAFVPADSATDASDAEPGASGSTAADAGSGRTRRRIATWALGAAAAVALGAAGAVAVIDTGDTVMSDPIAAAFDEAMRDRDSVRAELVTDGVQASVVGVIDQDGHGYLEAGKLKRLESDQTYQLWGVLEENGDVVSLGILGRNPELETFTAEGEVAALAITIEQSPGVISDGNPEGAFVGELS